MQTKFFNALRDLFTDAKAAKYVTQHIFCRYIPGNFRKMIHRLPNILS